MTTRPVCDYEVDILTAVGRGTPLPALYARRDWDPDDVRETLARHEFAITDGGSIVPAGLAHHELLELAHNSESAHVRTAAARAEAMLVDLARKLAAARASRQARDLYKAQQDAVALWLEWLSAARRGAQEELGRLASDRPKKGVA